VGYRYGYHNSNRFHYTTKQGNDTMKTIKIEDVQCKYESPFVNTGKAFTLIITNEYNAVLGRRLQIPCFIGTREECEDFRTRTMKDSLDDFAHGVMQFQPKLDLYIAQVWTD
jgi:hypothetical protein